MPLYVCAFTFIVEEQDVFNYHQVGLGVSLKIVVVYWLQGNICDVSIIQTNLKIVLNPDHRWRILGRPIIGKPERVIVCTRAKLSLHNYLCTMESAIYCPPGFVDGEDGSGNDIGGGWRSDSDPSTALQGIAQTSSNR